MNQAWPSTNPKRLTKTTKQGLIASLIKRIDCAVPHADGVGKHHLVAARAFAVAIQDSVLFDKDCD